ncbi:hypothetical protein M5K25_028484 [Dendrobium thyrsiflorum]|uniref:Uncharacterized protein n=1 Tax=Dendrobium thyrsiflorum TaxID=117978 RepID=A0ABD0TT69_DENTH
MQENELTFEVSVSERASSVHSPNGIGRIRSAWAPRLKQRELPRRRARPARERLKRVGNPLPL